MGGWEAPRWVLRRRLGTIGPVPQTSTTGARLGSSAVTPAEPPSGSPDDPFWRTAITVDWTTAPHALSFEDVLERLEVEPASGLSQAEADRRRETHGPNRLQSAERRSALKILLEQFASVVLIILGVAAVLAVALGHWTEAVAIAAVIVVNTAISFFSEWRAVRTMESLQRLDRTEVAVRREGATSRVPADNLVPGDIVIVNPEEVVPADLRVLEAATLRVEEAALTGESVPVVKRTDPVDESAPLAERHSMLFKGTSIAEGEAEAVVVATGMDTELGHISELAQQASSATTPLQKNLDRLGRRLAWITLAVAALVAGAGLLAGQPTRLMIETAIALGVAAIPEGLPIVATIALARGMWLMARRQAVVNRLTAVETLGATRVIFSDKTGTLTENRMNLVRVDTAGESHRMEDSETPGAAVERAIRAGVLCSNATLEGDGQGDPTEVALLEAGTTLGLERDELLEELPEVREESFDPEVMMMATFHRGDDGVLVAVKGAPDQVLAACDRELDAEGEERALDDGRREHWSGLNREMAAEGLRVLAVAEGRVADTSAEPYEELCLLGLVGLIDPPRDGVQDAVSQCQRAGIRVVMVTGDQPDTACAIARQIGLEVGDDGRVFHGAELDDLSGADRRDALDGSVFARVSPEQKLRLVELFQAEGETVAMTGDGVNDAPALKQADIGVAMGRRGTDAAQQVADMVLRDDALATIVAAVHQGRVIFSNIRRSVMFMLCTNVAEVVAVAVASVAGLPLPLRPLQILYLNVLTDVFPALALGVGTGSEGVMHRPPRPPGEPVLTRRLWAVIGGWSSLVAAVVLTALTVGLHGLGLEQEAAVTLSFLTLAFAKLWFVFNLSDPGAPPLANDVVRNPWLWGALALCAVLLLGAVYFEPLAAVLTVRAPDLTGWATVLGLSAIPFVVGQVIRLWQWRRSDG